VYACVGTKMISCRNNKVWLHDQSGVDRGLFYDTQYDSTIKAVLNQEPHMVKFWWMVRLTGNLWVAPYIETDHDNWSPKVMTSRLLEGRWSRRHVNWYADFLRALNDPNFETEGEALFLGEKLRGRYLIIELSTQSSTAEKILMGIDVEYSPAMDTMP